ncbi:MAG TPA: hypothetical protein VMA54_03015 [Steroidobacteraceae bacterium]|nr:hypothetical protein [Steroidobacteraceae bacterium]
MVVLALFFIGQLRQCAQRVPQIAANAVAHAASGIGNAAGNTVSGWRDRLWQGLKNLFSFGRDQWDNASPDQKFDLVCKHVPVEGVDNLCDYFTAALKGATDAEAAETACYWHAAATDPSAEEIMRSINASCKQTPGNPVGLERCVAGRVNDVDPGHAISCQPASPQQLWAELRTMIEPIACPFGIQYLCTTRSPSASTAPDTSSETRTDVNYTNCLQQYYLSQGVQAVIGAACGTRVTASNAACVKGQLQSFTYAGQNLGQQYLQLCAQQPLPQQ